MIKVPGSILHGTRVTQLGSRINPTWNQGIKTVRFKDQGINTIKVPGSILYRTRESTQLGSWINTTQNQGNTVRFKDQSYMEPGN